jgi:VRR-NUC domain
VTEAELQKAVIDTAHIFSWRVAHFRPAQTSKGWRTPVSADGKGFPDLVLVRERVVYAELKGHGGRLSQDQLDWISALRGAKQEMHVWYPSDWTNGLIERILKVRLEVAA